MRDVSISAFSPSSSPWTPTFAGVWTPKPTIEPVGIFLNEDWP